MMWPEEFKHLEELKLFLVQQLNDDAQKGFSFFQIVPGMTIKEINHLLGETGVLNEDSEAQQTLQYNAWIDHPVHGKRDHHKLNALFWAFHREPLEIIRLHVDYYRTGELAQPFFQFADELFAAIIEKFGKPDKKTSQKGNKEISYIRGKHKCFMWLNAEGIRIQIKS